MPRRHRLDTKEVGPILCFVVYPEDLRYWQLKVLRVGALFTYLSDQTYRYALQGYTEPLVQQLQLDPKMCLLRADQECRKRPVSRSLPSCPMWTPHCRVSSPKVPWCHQADDVPDDLQDVYGEVLLAWREGHYVLFVGETVEGVPGNALVVPA